MSPSGQSLGGSPITAIELLWDSGNPKSKVTKRLVSGLKTEYQIRGSRLKISSTYRFAVRASNSCGFSPTSKPSTVVFMTAPARMSRGTISQTPCGIKVTWKKPNNGGSPVTRFSIAIRGSNKKYSSLPNCGEQGEDGPTFCDASATVLEAAPYNLKPGQLIVVRTVAQNASGYGRSSAAFSGGNTFENKRPYKMYTPKLFKRTHDTIELRWTNLPFRAGALGKRVYSLYWNKSGDRAPLTRLVERIDSNKYVITGLE